MITLISGNILESNAEAIVNTVNCVGVMGRGIALQFKNAHPENFNQYKKACDAGEVEPGKMLVHETRSLHGPRWIINFPTKRHWKGASKIGDIKLGLTALAEEVRSRGIKTIAIPPLGAGLGGLDWGLVRPLIVSTFEAMPGVTALVYEPRPANDREVEFRASKVPKLTPGRATLVGLIQRYLAGMLDPGITLLEVHKLMYFMQVAGEPLRLSFVKAPYGPYAENLRHVLAAIEGHLIVGYSDGGDAPDKELRLVPGAVADATACLKGNPHTQKNFDRVVELVEGFESAYGLELLATVHWVLVGNPVLNGESLRYAVHSWASHKAKFTQAQIDMARDRLSSKGWLAV